MIRNRWSGELLSFSLAFWEWLLRLAVPTASFSGLGFSEAGGSLWGLLFPRLKPGML
jgi:hypothetical protein